MDRLLSATAGDQPMNLLQELRDAIQSYLDGRSGLEDLQDVLSDLSAPISAGEDAEATAIASATWRLMSEYGYGHRSEVALRRELARILPVHFASPASETRTTARTASSVTSYLDVPRFRSSVQVGAVA